MVVASAAASVAYAAEQGALVVLAHPPAASPTVMEALVHLRGELVAAGFETQLLEVTIGDDIRASLEHAAPTLDAVAVVAVLPVTPAGGNPAAGPAPADPAAAEMWVVDRVTKKTVVRRARADGEGARAAQILSVRAAELLRASFVELAITSQQPAAPKEPAGPPPPKGADEAARWATAALDGEGRPWSFGIELGGSVLGGPGGVGPSLLPILRVERAIGEHTFVRLVGAGLGAPVRVTTAGGYAEVTQDVLLADGVLRLRRGRRWQPLVSIGAGALRLHAEGHVSAPFVGESGSRWAAAVDGGVGVRLSLQRRIEVALEVHALFAEPYPVIRFAGADVARAGRPSGLATLTVVGGL